MSTPAANTGRPRYQPQAPSNRSGRMAIGGLLVIGVIIAAAVFVVLLATPIVHLYPATRQAVPSTYGSGIGADSLANIIVGGPRDASVSYRFRATESAALDRLTVYLQDGEGYSAGSGGTLRIELQEDDASGLHHPSGDILAVAEDQVPIFGADVAYSFSEPPDLVAGSLYHVVFSNVDPAPRENFISMNGLFLSDEPPTSQPGFPFTEWAALVRHGTDRWSSDRGPGNGRITPIMGLEYANGAQGGMGYMEVWVRDPRSVSGKHRVREVFTVLGPPRAASKVSVRVKRVRGNGPLGLTLEDANGRVVAEGKITARQISLGVATEFAGSTWVSVAFPDATVLESGESYGLVLSAPESTTYSVFAVREGSGYAYGAGTYFADGHAEYDEGSGWRPFHPSWSGPSLEGDLQFAFE